VSVTQLNIDVKIAGAEDAAGKLKKVEDAADATGKKAKEAGGLFSDFGAGVRKLDNAVDAVEKPMRALNGALDIASVALGVGLAGPLGMVIGQFIDFAKSVGENIRQSDLFVSSADAMAASFARVGAAASQVTTEVDAIIKSVGIANIGLQQLGQLRGKGLQLADIESDVATFEQQAKEYTASAEEARRQATSLDEQFRAALLKQAQDFAGLQEQVMRDATGAVQRRYDASNALLDELANRRQQAEEAALDFEARRETADFNGQKRARDRAALLGDANTLAGKVVEAEKKQAAAIDETAAATTRAAKATTDRSKAIAAADAEAERARLQEFDRVAGLVLAEEKTARARELASTPLALAEGLPTQGPTLMQALGDVIGPGAPAVKTISPVEESLTSLTQSAMDLESMGVGALQSFSQAAGQALATLVIDGDKAGVSFKKLAGQVAAGLSAQAFGYAVFLSALGVAAALTGPVLGYTAPGLFQGAAVMAGTGLLLASTARALGASTVSSSGGAASAGGSASGAQDRVSSFSAGGGGAQPVAVTVVLGVDEVSNVLVRQSQREARSGSLSSSRLAVA
jgi:hypothetical protein